MAEESQGITEFAVLFTAQKLKKFKTWQDGTMRYYNSNRKLVLIDEKGYNIDRKFSNCGTPSEGDEIEFDGHIVTVESCQLSLSSPSGQPIVSSSTQQPPVNDPSGMASRAPLQQDYRLARKRLRTLALGNRYNPITQRQPNTADEFSFRVPSAVLTEQLPMTNAASPAPELAPTEPLVMPPAQTEYVRDRGRIGQLSYSGSVIVDLDAIAPGPAPAAARINATLTPCLVNQAPVTLDAAENPEPSYTPQTHSNVQENIEPPSIVTRPSQPGTIMETHKRVRVGLSKRVGPVLHTGASLPLSFEPSQNTNDRNMSFAPASRIVEEPSSSSGNTAETNSLSKRFKVPFAEGVSVPLVIQFPSPAKANAILKSKKPPKRMQVVPTHFSSPAQYKDIFRRMIHEHIQILLLKYGVYYYSFHGKHGNGDLERFLRSKGLGFYSECELRSDGRFQSDTRVRLTIRNKENHAKYSKDDVWVVSKSASFDPSTTFLGRSTYYGPFSDGTIEIDCISSRDARVASNIAMESDSVCALRSISANAEFMMLDTLESNVECLPLLPHILTGGRNNKRKKQPALPVPALEHIKLRQSDDVNVEEKIRETVERYKLNEDQESVLRSVARSTITSPGWNEEPGEPVTLVHGVFGSGKSFLAAVLVIFLRDIVDSACVRREPEDRFTYKILISSMTNVAVDRILTTLVSLGFDHFVRVGSLKKIAKSLLPYTAKAKISGSEELKELEHMLEDPQNTEEETECIATTIQRFRKSENMLQITTADVIGTTCMASVFEVFSESKFPLVLLDESSQLMEPLTMVPLARFRCNRLIMIGDPLQLPPTLATTSDNEKVGQGLDKTLFDRMTEMGLQSVMLRIQYRCHPRISALSNKLFYDHQLRDGVTAMDRPPIVEGLPHVLFVDAGGEEQKSLRTNSFCNETELALSVHIIEGLMNLGVSATQIGVISLYKEQVDRLSDYMASHLEDKKQGIQISTVDAFQGGEKKVILLSTVRTTNSAFIDNHPRVNVALTRAKTHLMILGNRNLLQGNDLWSKILVECQDACMTRQEMARLLARLQPSTDM